ncbi:hypothetical protein AB835_02775 [Candidatus Endobugula sertula]|uniref:Haemolysin-type calcium binding-related domain-containing protein n=1 Tax=Candidatus Endobugula sertula TaxID=62101 RepID=A0A1D2QSN3_9GAMM|nr:hypothetical protein AB835_02775 [Candidatus Endobugula sertula]
MASNLNNLTNAQLTQVQSIINIGLENDTVDIRSLNSQSWLRQAYLNAGEGDDTVHGGNSNDMIVGGLGNDLLYGNGGRCTKTAPAFSAYPSSMRGNTYRFGVGAGQDVIINNDLLAVA